MRGRRARFMGNLVLTPHGSPIVSTPTQGKLNAPSPQPLAGGETSTERNRNMIRPFAGGVVPYAFGAVLWVPRAALSSGLVVVPSFSFLAEVFCCVCSFSFFCLVALLLCRVVAVARGGCGGLFVVLPVASVLCWGAVVACAWLFCFGGVLGAFALPVGGRASAGGVSVVGSGGLVAWLRAVAG